MLSCGSTRLHAGCTFVDTHTCALIEHTWGARGCKMSNACTSISNPAHDHDAAHEAVFAEAWCNLARSLAHLVTDDSDHGRPTSAPAAGSVLKGWQSAHHQHPYLWCAAPSEVHLEVYTHTKLNSNPSAQGYQA